MAWIRMVGENEAMGVVKETYERSVSQGHSGLTEVSEIVKVFSLRPDLLLQYLAFWGSITFGGSGLGRYREELIAVSISALVHCKF